MNIMNNFVGSDCVVSVVFGVWSTQHCGFLPDHSAESGETHRQQTGVYKMLSALPYPGVRGGGK